MLMHRVTQKLALFLLGCATFSNAAQAAEERVSSPVTDAMIEKPQDGDWLSWRRTLDSWGYSPLHQITRRNISRLRLVWSRGLPQQGKQEGTPLVREGVLYMPLPYSGIAAFDGRSGELIWEYRRHLPSDLQKFVSFPDTQRNIAIYGNFIIASSADDFVFAVDRKTGALAWESQVVDYHQHAAEQTSGPIVASGKVISGRGCYPIGGPEGCVITAHDPITGKELWRTSTIAKPGEAGDETWGGIPYESRWHVGTWMPPSYDPELKLIYFGTSVTSPSAKFALAGNDKTYLYHNSTLALDVDTGKIVWYYQHMVDSWDEDHTFERLLINSAVAPDAKSVSWINPRIRKGEKRKIVTGIPGKTGIVYTLDAKTGEFLWATPTVHQTSVKAIDGVSGVVSMDKDFVPSRVGKEYRICPGLVGGMNWPAGAYSPLTKTMYFPIQDVCTFMTAFLEKPSLESLYGFSYRNIPLPLDQNAGNVWAISTETGRTEWKYEQRAATLSLMTTGGGLLFGGGLDGIFRALDQKTGKSLWQVNLGAPVTGYPISFAIDGRQYVVASTGSSLSTGVLNVVTPEIHPGSSNELFVFALSD